MRLRWLLSFFAILGTVLAALVIPSANPAGAATTAPTLRSSSVAATNIASGVTVTKPAGTASGDQLVAVLNTDQTPSAPGWTSLGSKVTSGAGTLSVWRHLAGSSEPASYTFTSAGTGASATVQVYDFTGADTATPVGPIAFGGSTTATTAQVAPSVTPTNAPGLEFAAYSGQGGSPTYTAPSGMTARNTNSDGWAFLSTASQAQTSTAATGTRTATSSLSSKYNSVQFIVNGAGGTTPPPPPPSSSKPLFKGVNAHPIWYGPDKVDPLLNDASAAGVKTMRVDFNWGYMEPTTKGTYDSFTLGNMDYFMAQAKARGIDVLPVVTGAPNWANGGQGDIAPPSNPANYADFVQFVLTRYPQIKAVQVWDEPDGSWAWQQSGTAAQRASSYVALLQATFNRVHGLGTGVKVTGPTVSNFGSSPETWLKAFYAAGGKPYKDVLSFHFYGDPPQHGNLTPEQVIANWNSSIWPIIQANGDAGQELWFTESGYSTDPAGVSESTQANYLTRMYAAVLASTSATRMYWYEFFNNADGSTDPESNYGITHYASTGTGSSAHFVPKPALSALTAVQTPQ